MIVFADVRRGAQQAPEQRIQAAPRQERTYVDGHEFTATATRTATTAGRSLTGRAAASHQPRRRPPVLSPDGGVDERSHHGVGAGASTAIPLVALLGVGLVVVLPYALDHGPRVDAADRRRDHRARPTMPLARAISGLLSQALPPLDDSLLALDRRADRPLDRYCRNPRSRGITPSASRPTANSW
jgi:hypothetical protein